MRLWQKTFLLTLGLTVLAADLISLVLMIRNQSNSLNLAKEQVRTICDSAVQEIGHLIQEKREEEGCILVTVSELEEMFSELRLDINGRIIFTEDAERSFSIGENRICATLLEGQSLTAARLPAEAGSVRTFAVNTDGNWRIQTGTTVFWEGHFYRVEISSDLSGLLGQFQEDRQFAQWMSGGISLVIAAVLLFSILHLTRPLKQLEAATEQIAAGEYGYRVGVKRQDEIGELARHMNEMAAQIEAGNRQSEALIRSRETFIANMAHELKTPLTSILGFADIMTIKSDMTEEERREYASVIAAEAKRLKLLSSRLMELAAIQEGCLELHPVNFGELTERAVGVFAPVCGERQCRIRRKLQPVRVEADEALLTSLVLNLLDNALKASAPGQEIAVTLEKREGKAVLTVRDYGIGIPEAELGHVTEAFYMVDKARSRSNGGSGVGLALCQAVAGAHRGTLEIESREGRGTRVCLVLPIMKM